MSIAGGITNTIFLTFAHNQYAIAFFLGSLFSLFLLILKPSRYAVLLLIGFIILLVGFEYDKHIVASLEAQTLASLDFENTSASLLVSRTLQKILPFFSFLVGWGSIFLAMLIGAFKNKPLRE